MPRAAYFFVFPCFHVTYIKTTVRIKNNNSNGENGNTVMAFLPSGNPAETPPMRLLAIILHNTPLNVYFRVLITDVDSQ